MAKRNIRKTDPETTTAPERRRRTTATNGTASAAPKASRTRRKTEPVAPAAEAAAAAGSDDIVTIVEQTDVTVARDAATEVPHEHIAVRAYHIYLSRGAQPGDQVADWIAAERELRARVRSAR